jgi:hypothetical protein
MHAIRVEWSGLAWCRSLLPSGEGLVSEAKPRRRALEHDRGHPATPSRAVRSRSRTTDAVKENATPIVSYKFGGEFRPTLVCCLEEVILRRP